MGRERWRKTEDGGERKRRKIGQGREIKAGDCDDCTADRGKNREKSRD